MHTATNTGWWVKFNKPSNWSRTHKQTEGISQLILFLHQYEHFPELVPRDSIKSDRRKEPQSVIKWQTRQIKLATAALMQKIPWAKLYYLVKWIREREQLKVPKHCRQCVKQAAKCSLSNGSKVDRLKKKKKIPSWYPQCATTSLTWNMSEIKKKNKKKTVTCSARVKFLTGFAWGKESHNLISCNSWRRGSKEGSSVPSISSREKLRARKARLTSPSLSMCRHGKARGKKGNNTNAPLRLHQSWLSSDFCKRQ